MGLALYVRCCLACSVLEDLQLVVSPAAFELTFRRARLDITSYSRCDLALGNRAVLGLVSRVYVEPGVIDGGHSPIVVELRDHSAWAMCWRRPRRQLPILLSSCSPSENFKHLLEEWAALLRFSNFCGVNLERRCRPSLPSWT